MISKILNYQITQKSALLMKMAGMILFLVWNFHLISAQDPLRFKDEADSLNRLQIIQDNDKKIILFTGSSSIRMWGNITEYFPGRIIINTGFGGSHMSDLLFYLDRLVINYSPDQIIIYEGDNDLADGKSPGKILRDTRKVVRKIENALPEAQVALISAKPSLARWELKEEYIKLNQEYKEFASMSDQVDYIDVWSYMLDGNGEPKKEIFLDDSLHMNKTGYDIWAEEIRKFIR